MPVDLGNSPQFIRPKSDNARCGERDGGGRLVVAAAIRGSGWIRRGDVLDWSPGAWMPEGKWFGRF